MSNYEEITEAQSDSESPINESLMRGTAGGDPNGGMRGNFRNLDARVTALEAGGGSGGGISVEDPRIGVVLGGAESNASIFTRRRISIFTHIMEHGRSAINAFDPFSSDEFSTTIFNDDFDTASTRVANTGNYKGQRIDLVDDESRFFKVPKGNNYFGLVFLADSSGSDNIEIFVNGVTPSSLGLVDEDNAVAPNNFSSNEASSFFQVGLWWLGLDHTKDNIVEIRNTDSAAKVAKLDAVETGFITPPSEIAISLADVHRGGGQISVQGTEVTVSERDITFDAPLGYGRTDLEGATTSAVVRTVKGAEGAMTQIKPKVLVSASDTSLKVKTSFFFPAKGICLMEFPGGLRVRFSYTSKTETLAEAHTLNGVVFDSFFPDYTPLDVFGVSVSGTLATFHGDINIVLLADGTENAVDVSASNNKLDFKIRKDNDGAAVTFAATLDSGLRSADIIPLGTEIIKALDAAAPLADDGEYFASYDCFSHRWRIGVRKSASVKEFELLFSSGANFANSIHSDLGFTDTDLSGSLTYKGQNNVEAEAWLTFERQLWRNATHSSIKYSQPNVATLGTQEDDLETRWGLDKLQQMNANGSMIRIYTDDDCCGIEYSFMMNEGATYVIANVDFGQQIYHLNPSQNGTSDGDDLATRAKLITGVLTFPRGSHVITFLQNSNIGFKAVGAGSVFEWGFAGYRQLKCAKPLMKLIKTESAFKFYKIRPKSLYQEWYAQNYAVQGSNEKINVITYNGATVETANSPSWNGRLRQPATAASVDVEFTITGNCGGIAFGITDVSVTRSRDVTLFIVDGTTPPTEDDAHLVGRHYATGFGDTVGLHRQEALQHVGLKAGTYVARMKNDDPSLSFLFTHINIIDTVETEPDAEIMPTVANDDKTISWPFLGGIGTTFLKDNTDLVPLELESTKFKEGKVTMDQHINAATFSNLPREAGVLSNWFRNNNWYGNQTIVSALINSRIGFFNQMETFWHNYGSFSNETTSVRAQFDGRTLASLFSLRQNTKNGASPSGNNRATTALLKKNFFRKHSSDMPDVNTVNLSDTRGMRVGQKVIITADSQIDQVRRITSIIDDTSIDINEDIAGFANFTTANNAAVNFAGFHRISENNEAAIIWTTHGQWFLPLKVVEFEHEVLSDKIGEVATSITRGLITLGDLDPPIYKDGTQASWSECIPYILERSTTGIVEYPTGFFNVIVSTGNVDIKLTATRKSQ